ncbi:MAG TPA: xanthine dehydrogenase family protein subunit M [Sediminispirochaeta sp.]|nr:xanthine dehydrogenase family protein subunit M [Sediminispirochaeta sp.]
MRDFRFLKPDGLSDVLEARDGERENARILAGGTNLLSYIKMGRVKTGLLVDISRLDELKKIEEQDSMLSIGASLTIGELLESTLLRRQLPCLFESLKLFANPLIRGKATIGGNIADASPIADTVPILLVLEAKVRLKKKGGERIVELSDFFVGPGRTTLEDDEVLSDVLIPVPKEGDATFVKIGLRRGTVCSVTSAAARVRLEQGKLTNLRVSLGGVAPTPVRARHCEQALEGLTLEDRVIAGSIKALQKDINPISDVRGSAEYRRAVSEKLVVRALKQAAGMEV